MPIERLFIEESVAGLEEVETIQTNSGMPGITVNDIAAVYKDILSAKDPVTKGKSTLILTANKGRFIRTCPGTRYYNCCGYEILNIGTFCDMDCAYCILQAYFHPPVMQYYVNHDSMLKELEEAFRLGKIRRIGTGEFTDSLIWEKWTDLSSLLVPKFAGQSTAVLELKTKTTNIEKLGHIDHNRKTIVSWSLNTERIINSEERNTASLQERLAAAKTCQDWGYPLSFHFDPLLIYEGCEIDYLRVLDLLFSSINPDQIVWISLGTFRFMPDLKQIIQHRFAESRIVYGEFILGLDNKMRYFKPLRIALYQKMVAYIKEAAPQVTVYFCMEDDEVWEKTIGLSPNECGGLGRMLDKSAMKQCRLKI